MATIKLCDWTKQRLAKDAPTFKVTVGDEEFEVGEEGKAAILGQLEGEDEPKVAGEVVEKIVYRDAPPPPLQAAPPGIDIETQGDPFDPGPGSMPQPVQGEGSLPEPERAIATEQPPPVDDDGIPPLEIPSDTRQRLRMPTGAQADKVVRESTVREEGSLPTLTMGGKQQREAMKKLREIEKKKEEELQRKARGGINVNTDIRNKPGYYTED